MNIIVINNRDFHNFSIFMRANGFKYEILEQSELETAMELYINNDEMNLVKHHLRVNMYNLWREVA